MTPTPADEQRHEPDAAAGDWREAWWFATASPSEPAATGLAFGLSIGPGGHSEYCACVIVDGRVLLVQDDDVPAPQAPGLTVRAEGLWAELLCETPLEHWSTGLEAFGLAFDDPDDALDALVGERIAVGLDLEWEAEAPATTRADGYEQAGTLRGEILVGRDRIVLEDPASRWHRWGPDVTLPWRAWLDPESKRVDPAP